MARLSKDPEDGKTQKGEAPEPDALLEAIRGSSGGYLLTIKDGSLAKYIKKRWDRLEKKANQVQTELKVNNLRYEGVPFAQIHPRDPNRVFVPFGAKQRLPPTINKIRRAVHRYMAQVTADEPVMEGVPASHTDDARDAAEAATSVLRGEWHRMNLHRQLQRVVHFACIYRSGFWFFEYDKTAGGRTPAQKFFTDELTGQRQLRFVDRQGNPVDDAKDAAEIWRGEACVESLTPMNVRWSGSEYAHEADELMVAKLVTLSQAYEMDPALKEVKLSELVGHVPPGAEEWLHDIRGAGGLASRSTHLPDEDMSMTGASLKDDDSRLDEMVMLIHYFKKPSREYKHGLHAMVAGKHLVHSGRLRYGVMPVVQFKLLDDPSDPLGFALVDMLRDPQELLDFVNGQVLRYLQTLKRRWFVPLTSQVTTRDLLNDTRSVIYFNPNGGAPVPEQHGELPKSLGDWLDRFEEEFNDQQGIHDTMQGKHVPGVSSGRHAEALRSGDETLLGLTRTQIKEGLEAAGRIILEIAKKEWTTERRVSYLQGREYIESAFMNTDLGETSQVRLKRGTLLMLTPAQKLETLFGYAEMGAITQDELRRLAPLSDTAGISITEDPHYQRARRQNALFLEGPPEPLREARTRYEEGLEEVESQSQFLQRASELGAIQDEEDVQDAQTAMMNVQMKMQRVESEWAEAMMKYAPSSMQWEHMDPKVAQVHMTEHFQALASQKATRLPDWWRTHFEQHAMEHAQALQQMMNPQPAPAAAPAAEAPPPQG